MCLYIKKKELLKEISLLWFANSLEVGPQLNNIFGHYSIPAIRVCKKFNDSTKKLPTYFLLQVYVTITGIREFKFAFDLPNIPFFIKFATFQKDIMVYRNGRMCSISTKAIKLCDVLYICKLKDPSFVFHFANIKTVFYTVRSMNIIIVY